MADSNIEAIAEALPLTKQEKMNRDKFETLLFLLDKNNTFLFDSTMQLLIEQIVKPQLKMYFSTEN